MRVQEGSESQTFTPWALANHTSHLDLSPYSAPFLFFLNSHPTPQKMHIVSINLKGDSTWFLSVSLSPHFPSLLTPCTVSQLSEGRGSCLTHHRLHSHW